MMSIFSTDAELYEVVYFHEMDAETGREFGKLKSRVKIIEDAGKDLNGAFGTPQAPQPSPIARDNWLKRNSYWFWPIISIIFGSGVVGAFLSAVVDYRIGLKLTEPLQKLTEQAQYIAVIDVKQNGNSDLLKIVLQKEMSRTLRLPAAEFKQEVPHLSEILSAAARGATPPPANLFRDLGDKLQTLVKQNDADAWNASVTLASYHSVFNQNPLSAFKVMPIATEAGTSHYYVGPLPLGEIQPRTSASTETATKDTGALYAPIGSDLNPAEAGVNMYLKLNGGGVLLDGHHIRNVVFTGVHVIYNGGPLILDSAIFINCRFSVQRNTSGEQFIAKSLDSTKTTFTAGV